MLKMMMIMRILLMVADLLKVQVGPINHDNECMNDGEPQKHNDNNHHVPRNPVGGQCGLRGSRSDCRPEVQEPMDQ